MKDSDMQEIHESLGTIISSVAQLNDTLSQILCWIKKLETTGVIPRGTFESSRKEVLKKRITQDIEEMNLLLSTQNLVPDLEEVLIRRLESLQVQLTNLDKLPS